ncbi:FecR family protein [Sphingobacterium sp. SYP-B4668]|uniref:FecR family protein n=1 Tax=Sphingobacterium sp. SYP-B4668 TaxID=2996035 RepID=UPI0022DD8B7D|nr:FecR family protein [Sphingobacterium sp. SYP-B4668]
MKVDKDILHRYAQEQCTEEERMLVEEWFDSDENNRPFSETEVDAVVELLDKKIKRTSKITPLVKWSSVAAAIAIVGVTFYFYKNANNSRFDTFANIQSIKAPVSSYAVLIMEDNSAYPLDDIHPGDTLKAKGYEITRLSTGELNYLATAGNDVAIHILKTEKGGLATVQLTDGTKIWINSDSELRYPIGKSDDREVQLKGEGYFEVSTMYEGDQKTPFTVHGSQQTIQVLGTKFNADFTAKNRVALLEGKVALSRAEESAAQSKPIVMTEGQVYESNKVTTSTEIERYIDWKDGYFDLRKLNIYEFGMEISNWYRIAVKVEEGLSEKQLFGRINRHQDLKQVLEILDEVIPIQYEWKDNTLYIRKELQTKN